MASRILAVVWPPSGDRADGAIGMEIEQNSIRVNSFGWGALTTPASIAALMIGE